MKRTVRSTSAAVTSPHKNLTQRFATEGCRGDELSPDRVNCSLPTLRALLADFMKNHARYCCYPALCLKSRSQIMNQ